MTTIQDATVIDLQAWRTLRRPDQEEIIVDLYFSGMLSLPFEELAAQRDLQGISAEMLASFLKEQVAMDQFNGEQEQVMRDMLEAGLIDNGLDEMAASVGDRENLCGLTEPMVVRFRQEIELGYRCSICGAEFSGLECCDSIRDGNE